MVTRLRIIGRLATPLPTPADVIAGPTLTPRDRAVADLLTHLAEDRDALLRARLLQDVARAEGRARW